MRRIATQASDIKGRLIARVVDIDDLKHGWLPSLNYLVRASSGEEVLAVCRLREAGAHNLVPLLSGDAKIDRHTGIPWVRETAPSFERNDVVVVNEGKISAHVLFRAADNHHTVFLTNRCNSKCLMCSQPPTAHDDSWLVREAIELAEYIETVPAVVGFSGGEPLLLRENLRSVLDAYLRRRIDVRLEVLTNGRLFSDRAVAKAVLQDLSNTAWMVPLYGHADFLHDFVVQAPDAFEQTISGLLTLREYRQPIQLRIVLIEPVLQVLPELCSFIGKNLPFVREVALMACEPIGYALANPSECRVDLLDWKQQLQVAMDRLRWAQVPALIMNAPLCALPQNLWKDAHRSISDWKQVYAEDCDECVVKADCAGLFSWHEKGWPPTKISPIRELAQ